MVPVTKCMYNCDTRKLNTRLREPLRELSTTPKLALVLVLQHQTTNAWLKHSNYLKLKGCGHQRSNSLLEPQGTCWTNQHFFEASSTGTFHGVRIPSATYRWSCSKTDKSNCCPHETRFSEATCGFRRRDVVNCALNSGVRKTPSLLPLSTASSGLVPTRNHTFVRASGFSG